MVVQYKLNTAILSMWIFMYCHRDIKNIGCTRQTVSDNKIKEILIKRSQQTGEDDRSTSSKVKCRRNLNRQV